MSTQRKFDTAFWTFILSVISAAGYVFYSVGTRAAQIDLLSASMVRVETRVERVEGQVGYIRKYIEDETPNHKTAHNP